MSYRNIFLEALDYVNIQLYTVLKIGFRQIILIKFRYFEFW